MVGEMFRLLFDSALNIEQVPHVLKVIVSGAFRLLDDYRSQKRRGIKDPVFRRSMLPEIEAELECWE